MESTQELEHRIRKSSAPDMLEKDTFAAPSRTPTRNFLLRLSLLLRLSESETQRLLKIAGRPPLYARKRRDAAVLYGLIHGLTVEETDALLHSLNEEGLA